MTGWSYNVVREGNVLKQQFAGNLYSSAASYFKVMSRKVQEYMYIVLESF